MTDPDTVEGAGQERTRSLAEVVTRVCRMALDFYREESSVIDLARRSGYLSLRRNWAADEFVGQLAECLAGDRESVDAWLQWSGDNRSTPAWYIEELGPRDFEVGYFDGSRTDQLRFDDGARACAEYVHRQLEQIADDTDTLSSPASMIRSLLRRRRPAR